MSLNDKTNRTTETAVALGARAKDRARDAAAQAIPAARKATNQTAYAGETLRPRTANASNPASATSRWLTPPAWPPPATRSSATRAKCPR